MSSPKVVTVFGSGYPRQDDSYYAVAHELGRALAARGFVVCSGGYGGVMEAVSRGAKEADGQTIGITTNFFTRKANPWIDEEIRVDQWRDRLFALIERGDAYVACPGGTGTLVELAVAWELMNKGAMKRKALIALGDFWQPIIERVREMEREDNDAQKQGPLVRFASTPKDAVEALTAHFAER